MKRLLLSLSACAILGMGCVPLLATPLSITVTGTWVRLSATDVPVAPDGSSFRFFITANITPADYGNAVSPIGWNYDAVRTDGSRIHVGPFGALDQVFLSSTGQVTRVNLNYFDSTGIGGGFFDLTPSSGYVEFQQLLLFANASSGAYSFDAVAPEPSSIVLVAGAMAALAAFGRRRFRT